MYGHVHLIQCSQIETARIPPQTCPKFQQQLGRVVALRDMINWCIMNPLEGQPMELHDSRMVAMEAHA